jgi:AraC-like DNA-binding protein
MACVNYAINSTNRVIAAWRLLPIFISDKNRYMKLFLKYVDSMQNKMLLEEELEKLGLHYKNEMPGEAEIEENITPTQWEKLHAAFKKSGIAMLHDKTLLLIDKIKNVIVELVHFSENPWGINFSGYLSKRLNYDYPLLADTFLQTQGFTIEHFQLLQKMERVKELLNYGEMKMTEIARDMHYRSVAHLSNQFKKITGITPSFFKKMKHDRISRSKMA